MNELQCALDGKDGHFVVANFRPPPFPKSCIRPCILFANVDTISTGLLNLIRFAQKCPPFESITIQKS